MALEPRYPYDVHDAASYLSLSVSRVRELARTGQIACIRSGHLRFDRAGLDAWLNAHRQDVIAPKAEPQQPRRDVDAEMDALIPMTRRFS